nr:MAG TPA: portal protein [Caudoviricetes sp.]
MENGGILGLAAAGKGGFLPAEGTMPDGMAAKPIGQEQLFKFTDILKKYNGGKARTTARIQASEQWWKLRNSAEELEKTRIGKDGGWVSSSGWLHNVIVAKHADAMESYPEPNILPRERGDRQEAQMLSHIIPCVLEQNQFERTYSDAMWQKLKTGTGVYKIVWSKNKLNGLGDISVENVNLLNVYWEPGVTDIQQSRFLFHTELRDKEVLVEQYPELESKLKSNGFVSAKFLYDDTVSTEDKFTVIEVYYRKRVNGKNTLQYCKYIGDTVLYATENEPEMAERGLYDHGKYPYVFDALYPIEGSPCGYGYIDICKSPQTEIDLLKTAFVKNAMVGATPRYFVRGEGGVNENELADLSKPFVHLPNVDETFLKPIAHTPLDGNYINVMQATIQELRETSGNTETSTGNIQSGVTAASAIAALQEASGKGSRDSTQASYRAYSQIVEFCIELIRQFYDAPRQFRIVGQYGAQEFVSYDNSGIQPQYQGNDFGMDMGYRVPAFDIKISAQKHNVYTKVTQNELALQFFNLGFFNPQMADQALQCMDMMDFDGKAELMQKISQQGTMYQKLLQYMQLALTLAERYEPEAAQTIAQDVNVTMAGGTGGTVGTTSIYQGDNIGGIQKQEPTIVKNARSRAAGAASTDREA